jgi:hypothetical protein
MTPDLTSFTQSARRLSRNPLGIIALFIVLVYGIAALVLSLGRLPATTSVQPMIWFLVAFPVCVLAVFAWLVAWHHKNLYGPEDFPTPDGWLRANGFLDFGYASPEPLPPKTEHDEKRFKAAAPVTPAAAVVKPDGAPDLSSPEGRELQREALYSDSRRLFIVHILTPSKKPGQKFDVFIYVRRHRDEPTNDVASAEFYCGRHWGNKVFRGTREGNVLGIRTSAYGEFLCTCLVTFEDGHQTILHRYVDFEMGRLLAQAA